MPLTIQWNTLDSFRCSNYTIHTDACFSAKTRCVSHVCRLQPILIAQVRLLVFRVLLKNPVTETFERPRAWGESHVPPAAPAKMAALAQLRADLGATPASSAADETKCFIIKNIARAPRCLYIEA